MTKDANGSATCRCLFWARRPRRGRDRPKGRKRKLTGNVKTFPTPIFPHKYQCNLASQHVESWTLYQEIYNADSDNFSDDDVSNDRQEGCKAAQREDERLKVVRQE
uniref:Uncharacterized protein n=1 Tax=Peronospora matthiolae TaxID=2874970 RepID=A0AAV1T332_9STRA